MSNVKTTYLFPSQIVAGKVKNFEDIRENIVDWVYEFKENNPSISKLSNKAGWQSQSKHVYSDEGFQKFQEPVFNLLKTLVAEYKIVGEISLVQMWININGPNSYNVSHRHPGCHLSGCFWVQCPPESGRFVFDNMDNGYRDYELLSCTNFDHLKENNMQLEIVPEYEDGHMILFPASLTHRVELNETDKDRISLGFNLAINHVNLY